MVSSPTSRALGSWFPFLFFMPRHDGLDGEACSEEKVNLVTLIAGVCAAVVAVAAVTAAIVCLFRRNKD